MRGGLTWHEEPRSRDSTQELESKTQPHTSTPAAGGGLPGSLMKAYPRGSAEPGPVGEQGGPRQGRAVQVLGQ